MRAPDGSSPDVCEEETERRHASFCNRAASGQPGFQHRAEGYSAGDAAVDDAVVSSTLVMRMP